MNYSKERGIRFWAKEDRPREKMINWGRHQMSHAELLAILIGSGTRDKSAVDLARVLLKSVEGNLKELGKLDFQRLIAMHGIGEAKAVRILAALELGRRRAGAEALERQTIQSSRQAFELLQPTLGDLNHEQFWVLYLNNANKILQKGPISKGGISGTVVDIRLLFREGFYCGATSIIIAHNHPSGNKSPSTADRKLTERVKNAGELLDIKVLDHLIVTEQDYFSFADNNEL